MELKIYKGITLKNSELKDNDRLLSVFTPSKGKISVIAKGIKKAGAKLKFAAQPFCFGDFEVAPGAGGFYTLCGCAVTDDFYALTSDPERYYAACAMLSAADKITDIQPVNEQLFIRLLKSLKHLAYDGAAPETAYINFTARLLNSAGLNFSYDEKCVTCGDKALIRPSFDFSLGGVTCGHCSGANSFPLRIEAVRVIALVLRAGESGFTSFRPDREAAREGALTMRAILNGALGITATPPVL